MIFFLVLLFMSFETDTFKDAAVFESVHGTAPDIAGQDKVGRGVGLRSLWLIRFEVHVK